MLKIVNIQSLGKVYTVRVKNNGSVRNIRLIHEDEILNSLFGEYGNGMFTSFADYLKASCSYLTGFVDGAEHLSWYIPSEDGDIDMREIASLAVKEHNTIVIIQKEYDCIDD